MFVRMTSRAIHIGQMCEKKLRVLLDMDQVLADFELGFFQEYRKKFPDYPYIEMQDRVGFFVKDQYEKMFSYIPNIGNAVAKIYKTKKFFLNLPEIEGAVDAAKMLAKMEGVDVFICTSPIEKYKYCLAEKYEWVDKHLGPEWVGRIILTKDKTMANGHLLIDDKVDITGAIERPSWEHVVFSANHNMKTDIGKRRRLDNWTNGDWKELIEDFKMRI
ncbi:hypothetical protein CHS0354_043142 [Potamilus streckersoni]|uniref:Uncharacterized protein n=1 Tax=Potamilus streckersoni TaxID=2493646 RepID=A0AAE0VSG8_9BIVA|nr:hypothetical protein CHS0354_043142 [Potamilus streckersoni]